MAAAAASFLGLPRPPPCLRLGGMGGIGGGGGEGGGQAGGGGGGGVFWNRIEPNPRGRGRVCLCWARLVGPRVSHRLGVGGRWVGVRGARRSVSHARGFGFGGWASQSFDLEPRGCWNLWGGTRLWLGGKNSGRLRRAQFSFLVSKNRPSMAYSTYEGTIFTHG